MMSNVPSYLKEPLIDAKTAEYTDASLESISSDDSVQRISEWKGFTLGVVVLASAGGKFFFERPAFLDCCVVPENVRIILEHMMSA